jgi:hypothetical protein
MRKLLRLCSCVLLAIVSQAVHAEEVSFGDYTIHYIAVNSTFLQPEIAAQYDIVRGPRSAFLNIAVIREDGTGTGTPVTAVVSGHKRNMLQQQADITFSEVREGAAVYYIGQFDISDGEILRFEIDVQPEGQGPTHTLDWRAQLYTQ